MKRLLSFLLLFAVSISSYQLQSGYEVTNESSPAFSSEYALEYDTVKSHGALFHSKNLRRLSIFKYRVLSHFSLNREYAQAFLVKQFSNLFGFYRHSPTPIGLKLIFPQHFFW